MSIPYYLRKNNLKPDTYEYRASVVHRSYISLEQVIKKMVDQGSTVGRADILGVLANFQMAIETYLEQGFTIRTPFANFSSSIKGSFTDPDDAFTKSRHRVVPVVNAGKELHNLYRKGISTQKVKARQTMPNLYTFRDVNSDIIDRLVTPDGMGEITGYRLKFNQDDPMHGIFFIDSNGNESRVATIGLNKPSILMFQIPAELSVGEYALSVRNEKGKGLLTEKLVVE